MKRKKGQQIEMFAAAPSPEPEPVKAAPVARDLTPQAEKLLANFEVLAEAEGGVKRLRELILGLAVRGKLVQQDPADEPAEKLIIRIANSRGQAYAKRNYTDESSTPKLFELPHGWTWARFPELGEFARGKSKHRPRNDPSLFTGGSYPLVQTGDVARANGTILTHSNLYNDKGLAQSKLWPAGTLCITIAANIADSGILGFDACFPDSVVGFVPAGELPTVRFFEYFLRTAKERIEAFAPATAQKNINLTILEEVRIPLPPLAEQKRIVAKVDELMKLCDELEARQAKQRETGARLTKSALDALATAEGPAELAIAWERVVGNFEGLVSRADDVKKVRETVLSLAVRGRLVEQDPKDEPADVLLKRAKNARSVLIQERKIRQSEEVDYSRPTNAPPIPAGWLCVHLNDIALIQGGKRLPNGASFSDEPTPHIYIRVSDMKNGSIVDTGLKYISASVHQEIARYVINKDDLYITIAGTIGEVGVVPEALDGHNLTENAAKIVFRELHKPFLCLVLRSDFLQSQFVEKTIQMAQPKLALKRIAGAQILLPPLPEQKRIVAKVDQLMGLCDELESKLRLAEETARKVAEALVAELLQG